MKKSELLRTIVKVVTEICEVTPDDMIARIKSQSVTDARIIAMEYLVKYGLSADDIVLICAKVKGIDVTMQTARKRARALTAMRNKYETRRKESYCFRVMDDEVSEKLKSLLV